MLDQMTKLDHEIPSVFLPFNLSGPIVYVWCLLTLLIQMFPSSWEQGTPQGAAHRGREA